MPVDDRYHLIKVMGIVYIQQWALFAYSIKIMLTKR
uniref:Uncharacterized protein n=1 Tax=Siphoviridae sp. ctXX925 TaxID=2826370 RepID=A0A8S5R1Z6_9CAUD|nr:MAG TPA: hypothetical protein [Siphoviridae sp. ctXX925]